MPRVGKKQTKDFKSQPRTRGRILSEQSSEPEIKIKPSKKLLKKDQIRLNSLVIPEEIPLEKEVIEIDFFETKQTKKIKQPRFDHRFYPSKPEQLFPENLGDNMLKVIASFEKNCSIFDIEDNIQKFYINTVEKKTFRKQLRYFEDEAIVMERQGAYKVYHKLIPNIILEIEKQYSKQKIEDKGQPFTIQEAENLEQTISHQPIMKEHCEEKILINGDKLVIYEDKIFINQDQQVISEVKPVIVDNKPILSDEKLLISEFHGDDLSISVEKADQIE